MKKFILAFLTLLCTATAWSQSSFEAVIMDEENKHPLVGANVTVEGTTLGASTNAEGFVKITGIPDGEQTILFSYIGYEKRSETFTFPLTQTEPLEIFLHSEAEEGEEIVVSATRSSRSIADIPTRIEAISGEELDEKSNMKPGDIRMLLNESTGIQTQQTSAISFNSSIRIQGLDGKYTQILKDGFPLYAGFSGGLSLLQIVPLDLKQVEVIKGASSTLYGGGAIAGLVNLVSKAPSEREELSFLINGTSALGLDASGFYSNKFGKVGTTLFASYNRGEPYDPAGIGLTAIPEFRRYTINPKLFYYPGDRTTFQLGFNTTVEDRTGGDTKFLEGEGTGIRSYFEENRTTRFSTQFGLDHKTGETSHLAAKNSVSYYDRSVEVPGFKFAGTQISSFGEATWSHASDQFEWILGLNLWTDRFDQDQPDTSASVDYDHITVGGFLQNTWNATEEVSLETGLRFDHQDAYGNFLLPRIALLMKFNPQLTVRLGGGLGYKTPTVFTEDAERLQFRNVLPIDEDETKAEESIGGNFDVNYRTILTEEVTFTINSLLFYTRVNDPLVLTREAGGFFEFQQPDGFIDTKGVETNIKITYDHFKLFVGYTFADVNQHNDGSTTRFPLVARNRLNNVLIYEVHDNIRIGLEGYYFSPQKLSDGRTGKDYWIVGLMTEKFWESFSVFLNFENFLDTRQTKFETIYTGPVSDPVFNDIYAPLDGFVVNGGVKVRF